MKVYALAPNEGWIVDRMVQEWNEGNPDITTLDPYKADVVWLLADWCFNQMDPNLLKQKRVLTTIHHIVPEKFGILERIDFERRDRITTAYHVFNQRTLDFIRPLTQKPIHLVPYWANQRLWRPTGAKGDLRKKHGLPVDGYLVGSFQRDTEGHDLRSPKLEKGPDVFCDFVERLRGPDLHVVLAGWRRQYVIARLEAAGIPYTYFDRPDLETINELYQTLDVYAVGSRCEGGPQSLIECGLLDVPVVSTAVGIARQVLPPDAVSPVFTGAGLSAACPAVPNVEAWKLPGGFEPYRRLMEEL